MLNRRGFLGALFAAPLFKPLARLLPKPIARRALDLNDLSERYTKPAMLELARSIDEEFAMYQANSQRRFDLLPQIGGTYTVRLRQRQPA